MNQSEFSPEIAAIIAELDFSFASHVLMHNCGIRLDKCSYKGLEIRRETYTPKNKSTGKWGKAKTTYYLRDEKTIYNDLGELLKIVRQRTALKIIR